MNRGPSKQAMVDASLAFQTPAQPHIAFVQQAADAVIEGWVLKKRRKKLQGTDHVRGNIALDCSRLPF